MKRLPLLPVACLLFAALALSGCKKKDEGAAAVTEDGEKITNADVIKIDGSSTVYPITEAVAEEFKAETGLDATVGVSGTGGGMKKFCAGETAVTGASRPIKDAEAAKCKAKGIEFIELPVAYDGLAVVVHPSNDWADTITVDELRKIWEAGAQEKIMKWSQVRDGWPDKKLNLFGPGTDSGTYDYFAEAITGEVGTRGDFTASEDDNILVQGVSGDEGAMGFFGFAYYSENEGKLKVLGVDDGSGKPVEPSLETVANGTYQPLSRPLFLYISKNSLERPEVKKFANFYVQNMNELSKEVGYIPLPDKATELVTNRLEAQKTGSLFEGGGSKVGVTVEELLATE